MDGVQEAFVSLKESISDSIWTGNSVYGIVILFLFVLFAALCCKSIKYAFYLLGTFVFLELMHILAFATPIGTDLPFLQVLFKYDVFTALAQLCVGTPLSDDLLWMQAYLNTIVGTAAGLLYGWLETAVRICGGAITQLMSVPRK